MQPWSPDAFNPHTDDRRYSPQALALTLFVHLVPLLLLLAVPELLSPEKPAEHKPTRVELVPPDFVQVNPFANQQRINTAQEGAQNQQAAQEAEPDPHSRAEGPQLEGDDPRFNRIISGNPEAPDIAPAPLAAQGDSDSPNPPAAGSAARAVSGNSFELQTRAELLQQQASAEAQTRPLATHAPAAEATQAAAAEATQAIGDAIAEATQAIRDAAAEAQPAGQAVPLPPSPDAQLTAQTAEQPQHREPSQAEQVVAEEPIVQPAAADQQPAADQPRTADATTQTADQPRTADAATQTTEQPQTAELPQHREPPQAEQVVVAPGPVAQGTEATPAINPDAPRPRPVLEPRISAGPLRHQAVTANARGLVAIDSRFSEFGAYQQRMIEAISAQWYMLARQSRAIDSEYGTQVVLVFTMSNKGIVSDTKVRFTNASAAATLLCINAVESRSPFGPWTADMQRVLGDTQTVTFTFYYR